MSDLKTGGVERAMPTRALLVLAGGLVLALAGCQQEAGRAPEGGSPIEIGFVGPLTGGGAKYGEAARKAIELAGAEINQRAGVRGPAIRVVYEDSQGDPRRAVDAFRKLVSVNKVPAVIGDLFSSATLAVAPIANESEVVLLSPTSSAPGITYAGPFVFRNVASDIFEGSVMAEFARNRVGLSRVAVLYINNAYGAGIREVFVREFRAVGVSTMLAERAVRNLEPQPFEDQ